MKNIRVFLSENFPFFGCKIFNIFEQVCLRNEMINLQFFLIFPRKQDLIFHANWIQFA